jgi:hypothetical protein
MLEKPLQLDGEGLGAESRFEAASAGRVSFSERS